MLKIRNQSHHIPIHFQTKGLQVRIQPKNQFSPLEDSQKRFRRQVLYLRLCKLGSFPLRIKGILKRQIRRASLSTKRWTNLWTQIKNLHRNKFLPTLEELYSITAWIHYSCHQSHVTRVKSLQWKSEIPESM